MPRAPAPMKAVPHAADGPATMAGIDGLRRMEAAFAQAMDVRPDLLSESSYAFAGRPVRVRTLGQQLATHICRPFAHLRSPEAASAVPALTIDVWDESETGVPAPAAALAGDPETTWPVEDGAALSASPDKRLLRVERDGSVAWLDRSARRVVGAFRSADQLSVYERTRPFRLFWHAWYHDNKLQIIHAGLVARNGDGALLTGPCGAGKSTSAVACLCGGLDYLADDYVGVEESERGVFVGHSIYGSARLDPRQIARLDRLQQHAIPSDDPREDKSLLLLDEAFPGRIRQQAAIRVILLPKIVGLSSPRLRSATRAEALLRLAPGSMFLGPSLGAPGLDKLARLVEHVPSYWLELGGDVGEVPPVVERALDEALVR
jgi:hypothetical protein